MLNSSVKLQIYTEAYRVATSLTEALISQKGKDVGSKDAVVMFETVLDGVYNKFEKMFSGLVAQANLENLASKKATDSEKASVNT